MLNMECRRGAREATLLVLPFWDDTRADKKGTCNPKLVLGLRFYQNKHMYMVYASIKHVCIGSTPPSNTYV